MMIKVIKYASPKVIQFWGFLVLFVLFIVTGSAWTKLLDTSRSGLIVLYVLSHIAFNLGPNVTTFIVSRKQSLKTDLYLLTLLRYLPKYFRLDIDAHVTALLLHRVNWGPGLFKFSLRMHSRPRIKDSNTNGSEKTSGMYCR